MKYPPPLLLLGFLAVAMSVSAQTPTPGGPPVTVVGTAGAPAGLTGTTGETNITTLRIPGGSMGPNGTIQLACLSGHTNNANSKTLNFRFSNVSGGLNGSVAVGGASATATASMQSGAFIRNNNSVSLQTIFPAAASAVFGVSAAAPGSAAVNTALDSFLNITGTLANAGDTLTLQHCLAVVYFAP
jgi:hypothetical protein